MKKPRDILLSNKEMDKWRKMGRVEALGKRFFRILRDNDDIYTIINSYEIMNMYSKEVYSRDNEEKIAVMKKEKSNPFSFMLNKN